MNTLKTYIVAALILVSTNNLIKAHTNDSFDFSSVELFLKVAEDIEAGTEISDSTWNQLFETKGYQILGVCEFRKNMIKEMLYTCFSEKHSYKQDSILKYKMTNNFSDEMNIYKTLCKMTLANYISIKDNRKSINAFIHNFNFDMLTSEAKLRLSNFLASPVDSLISFPEIAFACFEPDGYSNQEGIILDINFSKNLNNYDLEGFLAHEMYHEYRRNFENKDFIETNNFTDQIDRLHNEAVADLIDKNENSIGYVGSELPEEYITMFSNEMKNTPAKLQTMDSIVCKYINNQISEDEMNSKMNRFFLSGGHPNGMYMTKIIKKSGYNNELVATFANPVEFIELYNKSAKEQDDYVFSEAFMNYLLSLKEKNIACH